MKFKDIFKSNEQKIKEAYKQEKEQFNTIRFNDKIQTFSKKELFDLYKTYLESKKNYREFIKALNICEKFNFELNRIINKIANYYEEENDINVINAITIFKKEFSTREELILDFEEKFIAFNERIQVYKIDKEYVSELIKELQKFNLFVKVGKKIAINKRKFEVLPFGNANEKIFKECEKIIKYMKFVNYLDNFIKKGNHIPYDAKFITVKNEFINGYEMMNYDLFDEVKYEKLEMNIHLFKELTMLAKEISEYQKDIRYEINELSAKIKSSKLLENVFDFQINELEFKYRELGSRYNSQKEKCNILIAEYVKLNNSIRDVNKKYINLISPIKNITSMLGIEEECEINDICDYYIYSLSKAVERKMHSFGNSKEITNEEVNKFIRLIEEKLYILTNDQKNAIIESVKYLNQKYTANCLIQGDVSSGKTIVTVALMFIMAIKKKKSVYIVPRRVLRIQHLNTLKKYNELFGLNLKIYDASEDFNIKEADIVLQGYSFSDKKFSEVTFDLGIIDEIQLFGVEQRNQVQRKYPNIDMFYTTATPHPRTKLISLIGNLDVIEIRQMPPGRKLKTTKAFRNFGAEHINRVNEEASKGNMTLVVCPLVKKLGRTDFESLPTAFLKYKELFPKLRVEQLRAEYSEDKKERIIENAVEGEIDILIATKSIEVGIDIPRASVIFIHYPNAMKIKWGVSQLHQLRGRIGRNNQDAYCYIETPDDFEWNSPIGSVLKSQDVFELTKNDFDWRGFEKIIGTKQSGKSGSSNNQEKRIKAYEWIAKNMPNILSKLDDKFVAKLEEVLTNEKIENLN